MLLVIRISGLVEIPDSVQATLYTMRLRRKYAAVLLSDTPEQHKLLHTVRNFVAYGPVSEAMLEQLLKVRGEGLEGKKMPEVKKILEQLGKKTLVELGVKPFFRLHPPRGGIESKKHFGVGKGVLGDNKEHINQLVERML
jgi:large subunit ribosomal protein L30